MAVTIADQGVGSVTHLLIHVMLARLWEPSEYGLFALMFALLVFLMGIHSTLVAEPMSILGPARHRLQLQGYLSATLRLQTLMLVVPAIVVGGLGLAALIWHTPVGVALIGLAVATPGSLSLMVLRRACYVVDRSGVALLTSGVYAVGVLVGLLVLHSVGSLFPASVLVLMGVASGIASTQAYLFLGFLTAPKTSRLGRIWRENWEYGRWVLAAGMAHWGGTGAYLFFVGALVGLAETGAFRAMETLIGPGQQTVAALGLLLLPWMAGRRSGAKGSIIGFKGLMGIWGPVVAFVLVYGILLAIWGEAVTNLVYGREEYNDAARLLPVFALFMTVTAVARGLGLVLRSAERSQPIFWSKLAACASALLVGLGMTWCWGFTGAVWGMTLSVLAEALVLIYAMGVDRGS